MRLNFRLLPTYAFALLAILFIARLGHSAQPQGASEPAKSDKSDNWSASTEQQSPSVNWNQTRTLESHTSRDGRTVDGQTVQRRGFDGRYEPYLDTEKESVRVDANTVRTIERRYGRDPDGRKTLIQVTEEESRALPGSAQKVVRTTSNPDGNGQLQIAKREIEDSKPISSSARETKTTVLSPDANGGLVPTMQTQEVETRRDKATIESRKSTSLPDGNGKWQVSEVREAVLKEQNGKFVSKDERVLQPDAEGKLALKEHTITKEAETGPGEKRQTVETHSANIPGTAGDGTLRLNQRITTVRRVGRDGGQTTEEQVEQSNLAAPSDGLRTTQKTIDIVRPGAAGKADEKRTIESLNTNGDVGVVWVDMRSTSGATAVRVDTRTPAPKGQQPR